MVCPRFSHPNDDTAHAEFAACVQSANDALSTYKPRMVAGRYSIAKIPVYGPKFEQLKGALKSAQDNLSRFIGRMFSEWCKVRGIVCIAGDSRPWEFRAESRAFSRHRVASRQWIAVRDQKLAEYKTALGEFKSKRAAYRASVASLTAGVAVPVVAPQAPIVAPVPEVAPVNTGAETFSRALSDEIYPPSIPAIVAPVETREPLAPDALALAQRMTDAIHARRASAGHAPADLPREVTASVAFLAALDSIEPARIVPAPADTFAEAVLVAIRKAADDIACLIRMGWDRAQAIADTREVSTLGTRSWARVLSLIGTHGTALAIA
jgi:hypothetical protein